MRACLGVWFRHEVTTPYALKKVAQKNTVRPPAHAGRRTVSVSSEKLQLHRVRRVIDGQGQRIDVNRVAVFIIADQGQNEGQGSRAAQPDIIGCDTAPLPAVTATASGGEGGCQYSGQNQF